MWGSQGDVKGPGRYGVGSKMCVCGGGGGGSQGGVGILGRWGCPRDM